MYCEDWVLLGEDVHYHVDGCTKNKRRIRILTRGLFWTCIHNMKNKSGCIMLKEKKKLPCLERWSPVHGGEFPSSQVPCLNSTAFMPPALPSPLLPAKRTFIYTQTTLNAHCFWQAQPGTPASAVWNLRKGNFKDVILGTYRALTAETFVGGGCTCTCNYELFRKYR